MREVLGNLHINRMRRPGNAVDDLDFLVKGDGVKVAHRVVIEPHAVLVGRVFRQRVRAVSRWLAIEAQVDRLAGYHGRVVGDALEDIDAGVVTFAPCCSLAC